jgi:hypothetical protein
MVFCVQDSRRELAQIHQSFDPWEKSFEPVLQGKVQWSASQIAETKAKMAIQKARISKLEYRIKPGSKVSITDLNEVLWENGRFASGKLPPGDAFGHAYDTFVIGRAPWVPAASLAVLASLGDAYWGEYGKLPDNIKMPTDAVFLLPSETVIANATRIYQDYFVIDHAIRDYLIEAKRRGIVAAGANVSPGDLANAYLAGRYFYKVPSTDPFGAAYGPFVAGEPVHVAESLQKQFRGSIEEGFWQNYK